MILEVKNLHKSFKNSFRHIKHPVLKGVSFEINEKEIFGYLGPNGAGKTTTIKSIMGLIKPDKGHIQILGGNIRKSSIRKRVGYLPENPSFYPFLTAYETLDLFYLLYDYKAEQRTDTVRMYLSLVGLNDVWNKRVGTFSKGMVQRLGIAQAIINDPDLIILDEPLSGLDPVGRKEVRDIIIMMKNRGKTILFSSHILPDIEMIADRVSVIHRGEIVGEGQVRDIIQRKTKEIDIEISIDDTSILETFRDKVKFYACREHNVYITANDEKTAAEIRNRVENNNGKIVAYMPRESGLEEYFLNLLRGRE